MTMTGNPIADLQELWQREIRDFLSYVVEFSSPVVVKDPDQALLDAFRELHDKERALGERAIELTYQRGGRTTPPPFSLGLGHYNFARPVALVDAFLGMAQKDIQRAREIRVAYEDSDLLEDRLTRYLADDLIALCEEGIKRVRSLAGDAEAVAAEEAAKIAKAAAAALAANGAATGGQAESGGDEGPADPPWHDDALGIQERMELVKGKGKFEKLFAAMAQTDCTACGYDCEGYAKAIASGEDDDVTKCSPGGEETQEMLERVLAGEV